MKFKIKCLINFKNIYMNGFINALYQIHPEKSEYITFSRFKIQNLQTFQKKTAS